MTVAPSAPPATSEVELVIGGMTCASCSSRVQRHLNKVEGVDASVNLATEVANVRFDPERTTPEQLIEVVRRAGYTADTIHDDDTHVVDPREGLATLEAAIGLSAPIVAMSMVPQLQFSYWQWVAAALATPVVLWAGRSFHRMAWKSLRQGEAGMDTLISLGSLTAWGYSIVALLLLGAGGANEHMRMSLAGSSGDHPVYFEVAAGVVTLILLGRYLESRARRRAGDAVRSLLTLQSREARVIRGGTEQMIGVRDLVVGDQFVVWPGEKVPTDGTVTSGSSTIDAAMVTGESLPVEVAAGDTVTGATINVTGRIVATATRVGAATTIAQIAARVRRAQAGKAQIQRLADRVSAIFVPIVILVAVATLGYWIGSGLAFTSAFGIAVAVLIVACPCAMGLATPVALMAGTGRGAQLGILIGGAEVLESTQAIDTVVLDKTGTLTSGNMRVVDLIVRDAEVDARYALRVAAALEGASTHPIARAVVTHAGDLERLAIDGLAEHGGKGITARVDDSQAFVGSVEFAASIDPAGASELAEQVLAAQGLGHTVIAVGWDARFQALISVADTARPESAGAIQALRGMGLRVMMLTGDNETTALAIASALDLPRRDVIAGVLPTEKADAVKALQDAGATVAMVGDGINDAPALAQADLGIAMGSGSDVAIQAGDITLTSSDITKVPGAIQLARTSLRTIQGNLFWAFAYNVLAIPLAMSGHLNPLIAAAAMAFSSLFVVLNSLRLRSFQIGAQP